MGALSFNGSKMFSHSTDCLAMAFRGSYTTGWSSLRSSFHNALKPQAAMGHYCRYALKDRLCPHYATRCRHASIVCIQRRWKACNKASGRIQTVWRCMSWPGPTSAVENHRLLLFVTVRFVGKGVRIFRQVAWRWYTSSFASSSLMNLGSQNKVCFFWGSRLPLIPKKRTWRAGNVSNGE